jgi:indolepyruvate ferredoxin oxidoreductase, beta subunit
MSTTLQTFTPRDRSTDVRAITIAILAMGGEGGGVLADWIVDMAEQSGYLAQTTSVPGVAQRTGTTIYYVELFPESEVSAAGKDPVLALMPVPGEVDVLIASELMEAARAVQRGLVTPDRTTLIASTHRVYSMTEKTAIGDGRVDAAQMLEAAKAGAKIFVHDDFARIASESNSVMSSVLFGALAGASVLPFRRAQFEKAIQDGGVGVAASLDAFAAGYQAATSPSRELHKIEAPAKIGWRVRELTEQIESQFPPASRGILRAGIERLADYQDVRYAAEYLELLGPIAAVEAQSGHTEALLLSETARYLALWMSYEDASRVADLKIRRTRFERVLKESRATGKQLVQIKEFLYPRSEEIADVLPGALGRWLMNTNWMQSIIERYARGGQIVETTSLRGFLKLYFMAEFRRWRRSSMRFRREHLSIHIWLALLPTIAKDDYALAVEVAECPRLLKGYGDTHARGERNYNLIMDAVQSFRGQPDAAKRLRTLREAALADDTGEKLKTVMQQAAA